MARVGCDLDDVLFPFVERFVEYSGNRPGDTSSWKFWKDWGWTQERFDKEHDDFIFDRMYQSGNIIGFDTLEYLDKIRSAGHQLVFITARKGSSPEANQYIQSDTKTWLKEWDIRYDELHFTTDKTSVPVDYMIDDNLKHYNALTDADVKTWLMDKPWNVSDGCNRVNSFAEYAKKILGENKVSDEVRVTSTTGGQKGEKSARFDLIPADAMIEVAKHYGFGAKKYSDNNWRLGYPWHLVTGALERHLNEFKAGRDYDLHNDDCPADCLEHTESHHMAAVVFHALAILTFKEEHPEFDDRFKVND